MAHPAMSGNGTTADDDPLQTAVWRLRSRACWADAAALLPTDTAERRRSSGPRCWWSGACTPSRAGRRPRTRCAPRRRWPTATRSAGRPPASAASSPTPPRCSGYGTGPTRRGPRWAGRRRCSPPGAPGRALLDFRRGLIAENLADSPQAARAAYRRAHAGATAQGDPLLLSFTWRHLAGLALREGELAEARHGFAESLRMREELGYLVGTAPALVSLADDRARTRGLPPPRRSPPPLPPAGRRPHLARGPPDPAGPGGGDGLRTAAPRSSVPLREVFAPRVPPPRRGRRRPTRPAGRCAGRRRRAGRPGAGGAGCRPGATGRGGAGRPRCATSCSLPARASRARWKARSASA